MLVDETRVVPMTLLLQAVASLVIAIAVGIWQGRVVGASVLAGGLIAVIPNAFLAARLYGWRPGASAEALMRRAWIGEIGKFVLTALLFIGVFTWPGRISAPAVFGGFIAAQLVVFAAFLGGGRASGETRMPNKS